MLRCSCKGFKMYTVGTTTLLTELHDPESLQNFALLHTQNLGFLWWGVHVFHYGSDVIQLRFFSVDVWCWLSYRVESRALVSQLLHSSVLGLVCIQYRVFLGMLSQEACYLSLLLWDPPKMGLRRLWWHCWFKEFVTFSPSSSHANAVLWRAAQWVINVLISASHHSVCFSVVQGGSRWGL